MDPNNPADFSLDGWLPMLEHPSGRSSLSSPHISQDEEQPPPYMEGAIYGDSGHRHAFSHDPPSSSLRLPQANSTALNTDTIPHGPQEDSESPKDTGLVLQGQRQPHTKPRQSRIYVCQFVGRECSSMKNKDGCVFKNVAQLKEDSLRHLNAFQCPQCAERFGKRYGRKRHREINKKPCEPVHKNNPPVPWVSKELRSAVRGLENAKGYNDVMEAIEKCKSLCDLTKAMPPRQKKQPRKSASQFRSVTTSNQSGGSLTPSIPRVHVNYCLGSNFDSIDPELSQPSLVHTTFQTPSAKTSPHLSQEIDAASTYDFNTTGATVGPGTGLTGGPGNPTLESPLRWPMGDYNTHHSQTDRDPQHGMDIDSQIYESNVYTNPGFGEGPTYSNPETYYSPSHPYSNEAGLSQWNWNENREPLLPPAFPSGTLDSEFRQPSNPLEPVPYNNQQMSAAPGLHREQGIPGAWPDLGGETGTDPFSATGQFNYPLMSDGWVDDNFPSFEN